ncbi:hypothetical protein HBI24_192330 [Parastagonospora nodorum]|nr:hypothetical protein HBI79_127580 [Parastagonospora nodorum]KAH5247417.1 hypothetical protein HBI71_174330 [Parastagonospora nodorum]KAH5415657.1 hypothetical protein HBI47_146860 [Parastagonospora nodorum]KAH5575152.1 hypothetical protein HBI24_192330 [Parastagonospora nodorum]KAH5657760.1 hypothetical protein HBI23_140360 [Parastagonospora nodorum]
MRPTFGRADITETSVPDHARSKAGIESVVIDDKGTLATEPATGAAGRAWSGGLDQDAQLGVRKAQATTLIWTKTALYTTLSCIWIYTLSGGFRASINSSMTAYATSEFGLHSLLTVVDIVSGAMTAACYIPLAKGLDLWGRAEGFMLMVGLLTVGMILQAAAPNLPALCAGRVFSSVGAAGAVYAYVIVAVDTTSLRNRGLAFAFTSSPYMVTAFAGPRAAQAFEMNFGSWRWAFGTFAIITPFVAIPLCTILRLNLSKARKAGLMPDETVDNGRNTLQTLKHVAIEFDIIGVILFAFGLMIFLLPFNLAASASNGWATGWIIAMIIIGFAAMVLFCIHEYCWAPSPWLPWHFLTDRSMVGTCALNMVYQISYYTWNLYFQSFLQVVFNLSIAEAGYINNTFSVVSGVLLFIVGYAIRRTGLYRWLFYIAVPLYTFTLGLMIHFRQPNGNIGYIIMCEIFISIGGAVFILVCQLSVLSAVDHQHTSSAMSLLYVSGAFGGAIGPAISGAIWTNVFPSALAHYLPESAQDQAALIAASLPKQLSYPVGSEERLAIQLAYGYGHTRMLAAGVAFSSLMLIFMLMINNKNIKDVKQTKGVVF